MKRTAETENPVTKVQVTPLERAYRNIAPIQHIQVQSKPNTEESSPLYASLDWILPYLNFWDYDDLICVSHTFRYKLMNFPVAEQITDVFKSVDLKFEDRTHFALLHHLYELFCSDLISSKSFFTFLVEYTTPGYRITRQFRFFLSRIPGAPAYGIWEQNAPKYLTNYRSGDPIGSSSDSEDFSDEDWSDVDYKCAFLSFSGVSPQLPISDPHFGKFNKNDKWRILESIYQGHDYVNLAIELAICGEDLEKVRVVANFSKNANGQKRYSCQCRQQHEFPSIERIQELQSMFPQADIIRTLRSRFTSGYLMHSFTDEKIQYILNEGIANLPSLVERRIPISLNILETYHFEDFVREQFRLKLKITGCKSTCRNIGKLECFQTLSSIASLFTLPNINAMDFILKWTPFKNLMTLEPPETFPTLRYYWKLDFPDDFEEWILNES